MKIFVLAFTEIQFNCFKNDCSENIGKLLVHLKNVRQIRGQPNPMVIRLDRYYHSSSYSEQEIAEIEAVIKHLTREG